MIFELHFFLLSVEIVEGASIIQECIRSNGADYRGGHRTTTIGTECVNWMDAARQHNLTDYRDTQSGVGDHNYCRNPDASDRPWCYVLDENGTTQRQDCDISICKDYTSAENPPASSRGDEEVFELVPSVPAQSDNAAVQPVVGISQRVQTGPKKKKDLGTLGYVLGILMITIIILLGVGITFGYLYKRGRDLQQQREQRAYEREMQRITLPLSAFSNPACELAEENTVIVITGDQQTPCQEGVGAEGGTPLIGQAGTPGA